MTRIFLVAGEASGDIHGANLISALRRLAPDVVCEGLGGQRMGAAGMALRCDLASKGIMGFTEVLKSLHQIRLLFIETLEYIKESKPQCLVLIDYPGFNIMLAKSVHRLGIPIVYYISPQVWAWKRQRIYTLARLVKKMLVILPFEEELYRSKGVDCVYVGHPLLDHIEQNACDESNRSMSDSLSDDAPLIGILPGSREQEIDRILPPMLATAAGIRERYPNARFVAACVDADRAEQISKIAGSFPVITLIGGMYNVLSQARFCLVASGTATVEAALFGAPMVILYKVSPVTYWLARLLVRVDHIGMVNILAGKRIAPEFIQGEATAEAIAPIALDLIDDTPARAQMVMELERVRQLLGGPGASERAAEQVLAVARESAHV